MQFSVDKLSFPDEKSANFSTAPKAPTKFFAPPPNPIWWGGQMADFGDGGWGAGPIRPHTPMYAPACKTPKRAENRVMINT